MPFPNKKELEKIRKKLENAEPSLGLPKDAAKSDILKHQLCRQIIAYLRVNELTQRDLADKLGIDPSRVNEIIKYKADLFTFDRLMGYLESLNPKLNAIVA